VRDLYDTSVAYRFIEALAVLEQDGELEPILRRLQSPARSERRSCPEKLHGKERAREVLAQLPDSVSYIRSTFRNIVIGDNSIAPMDRDRDQPSGKRVPLRRRQYSRHRRDEHHPFRTCSDSPWVNS